MSVRGAQSWSAGFSIKLWLLILGTSSPDSPPTGTLYVNGTSNAASVTITGSSPDYKAVVTLPTLSIGDVVQLKYTVVINTDPQTEYFAYDICDMVLDSSGRVDMSKISGTAQTARDIGASVLLSSGTGAGQISLSSGTVTVGTNNDKTGYTASTVSDKTGYSLANGSIVSATFGTCDFTSTMKASLNAATPAVTVSDKTGFSLVNGSFVTATFGTCDFTSTMKTSLNAATVKATDANGNALARANQLSPHRNWSVAASGGDYTTATAAIAAASAGDTISGGSGTFNGQLAFIGTSLILQGISPAMTVFRDILGQNPDTEIILAPGSGSTIKNATFANDDQCVYLSDTDNVKIDNIVVNGTSTAIDIILGASNYTNGTITNSVFTGGWDIISVLNAINFTADNVTAKSDGTCPDAVGNPMHCCHAPKTGKISRFVFSLTRNENTNQETGGVNCTNDSTSVVYLSDGTISVTQSNSANTGTVAGVTLAGGTIYLTNVNFNIMNSGHAAIMHIIGTGTAIVSGGNLDTTKVANGINLIFIAPTAAQNRAEMDSNSTKLARLPVTGTLVTNESLAANHGSGPYGGGTTTITPLQVQSSNPRYSVSTLADIGQGSAPVDVVTIIDANKAPVDLSGKTVRLVFATVTSLGDHRHDPIDDMLAGSFKYETGGNGLTVGGSGNNQITVQYDSAKMNTPDHYRFFWWNVTDKIMLGTGSVRIIPTVFDYP